MIPKILLLLVGIHFSIADVYCQKSSVEIGGKLITEFGDGDYYGPGAGLQFIYKLSKHSGIETGLYYEVNPRTYYLFDSTWWYSMKSYREKILRIPFLYRFETRLFNITAGGAFDYLLNKGKLDANPPFGLKSGYFERTEWLATLSLSKNFYLKKSLILEPEIRASSPIPDGGVAMGFNISLRKKIF